MASDFSAARPARWSGNLRGIAWMMLSMPLFQAMNSMLKHIGGDLPAMEVVFFRYTLGFIVLLPWLVKPGGRAWRTYQPMMQMLRAACHVAGMGLWIWALTLIPLATANALMFTSPLFVALLAVLVLREPSHAARWLAAGAGFAGALIIIRPGAAPVELGALIALGSVVFLSASKLLTKVVLRTDSVLATVFYLNLFMSLIALVPALLTWQWPEPEHYLWFAALACLGAVAHLTLTRAFSTAELTALQPVEFVNLLWAALFGLTFFAEVPDAWVFVGGAVIVLSVTALTRYETRRR